LTDQERGACEAALHLSQHTKIELLPNVHINERSESSNFNSHVLNILQKMDKYKTKLTNLMTELQANTTNVPSFACMQDDNDEEALNPDELVFCKHVCDRQVWDEQLPKKMGLYHAFALSV
jgi:hypothetical protein